MIAVAVAVIIGVVAVTCGIVADSNHPDSLAFLGVMVRTTAAQIFLAGAICTWALFAALWLLSAGIHRSRERGIELRALRAAAAGVDLVNLDLDADPSLDPDLNAAARSVPAEPADPRLDRGRAGAAPGTGAGTGTGADVGYGYEQPDTNHDWPGHEGWDGQPDSNRDWHSDGDGDDDWDGHLGPNTDWHRNQHGQTGTNPDWHENRHGQAEPNPDWRENRHGQPEPNPDSRRNRYGQPALNPDSRRNQHGQTGTNPGWHEDGNWDGRSDISRGWREDESAHGDGRGPGHGTESWENADWPNGAAAVAQTPSSDACGPTGSSYLAIPIRSEPDVLGSPNTAPGTDFASYAFPGLDSYRSSAFAISPVSDQTTSDSIPPTSARPESDHPASDSSGPVQPGSNSGSGSGGSGGSGSSQVQSGADSIRSGSGAVGSGFSDGTSPAAGLDGVDPRRARKPVSE